MASSTASPKVSKRPCTQCGKPNAVPPKRLCPTCARANKKASAARAHERQVGVTYGLLPGDYERLMAASNGRCYICGGGSGKRLVVDHDHKKQGRESVRGLCCQLCNLQLLGRIGKDDPVRLALIMDAAIRYLQDPPAQRILSEG